MVEALTEKLQVLESSLELAQSRTRGLVSDNADLRTRIDGDVSAMDYFRKFLEAIGQGQTNHMASINEDAIVDIVLARIPSNGAVVVAPPIEVLRDQFMRDEVDRIVGDARSLEARQRRFLLWLIQHDGFVSQQNLVRHVTGELVRGGNKQVEFAKELRGLSKVGLAESAERQGWHQTVRERIKSDLGDYQAPDAEVDKVFQQVVGILAHEMLPLLPSGDVNA